MGGTSDSDAISPVPSGNSKMYIAYVIFRRCCSIYGNFQENLFSGFRVHKLQTNKQTNKQTNVQTFSSFIDIEDTADFTYLMHPKRERQNLAPAKIAQLY